MLRCVTIAESRGFGPGTLQVNGRIYAVVSRAGSSSNCPAPAPAEQLLQSAGGEPWSEADILMPL
jgi:hypothetical protein